MDFHFFAGSTPAGSHVANSQRQGLWDMRYECSIRQLLLEIGAVRELSRKEDSALEETEVLEINKAVLAGTYTFYPFRIVVLKKDDPLRDKFFAWSRLIIFFLFIWSLRMDELVLMSLGGFSTALLIIK